MEPALEPTWASLAFRGTSLRLGIRATQRIEPINYTNQGKPLISETENVCELFLQNSLKCMAECFEECSEMLLLRRNEAGPEMGREQSSVPLRPLLPLLAD